MARHKKRALWVDAETTYGEDPSPTGSGYLWVPARNLGDLVDNKTQLETAYQTGRNWMTAPIAGQDGWSLEFSTPVLGMVSAAGDGEAASSVADDWYDTLLFHVFGSKATTSGETVAVSSASTSSTLDTDTDVFDAQHMVAVYDSTISPNGANRTQWALVTDDGASSGSGTETQYAITPAYVSEPTTSAVAYGAKIYRADDDGGSTLSFLMTEDDEAYLLSGGRCTSCSITFTAGEMVEASWSFSGTSKTNFTPSASDLPRANCPRAGVEPGATPVVFLGSAFFFNGTRYAVEGGSVDMGITANVQLSSEQDDGRSGYPSISVAPTMTVRPLRDEALQTLKRSATAGRAFLQLGAGILSGNVLNTSAFHFENAVITTANTTDSNGEIRQEVQITAFDGGRFGADEGYPVQYTRS